LNEKQQNNMLPLSVSVKNFSFALNKPVKRLPLLRRLEELQPRGSMTRRRGSVRRSLTHMRPNANAFLKLLRTLDSVLTRSAVSSFYKRLKRNEVHCPSLPNLNVQSLNVPFSIPSLELPACLRSLLPRLLLSNRVFANLPHLFSNPCLIKL
jgi:hypothetical protein